MIKFDSQEKFSYESYHLMKKNETIFLVIGQQIDIKGKWLHFSMKKNKKIFDNHLRPILPSLIHASPTRSENG